MLSFSKKMIPLLVGFAVVGCTNLTPRNDDLNKHVDTAKDEVRTKAHQYGLKIIESAAEIPGGMTLRVNERSGFGDITLNASGSLNTVINGIAKGYSTTFMGEVQRDKFISVSLSNLTTEAAVKRLANAAGYVALIDGKSITITDEATYTFRVPKRLLESRNTNMDVGGNPLASAASQTSASGGTSSSGGSTVRATFTTTGKFTTGADVGRYITEIAGANASVSISETGYITVRANAIALERIHKFLNEFVYDGNRRADIKVSLIEVTLTDRLNYGIDWTKTLDALGGTMTVGAIGGATGIANPTLAVNYTSASIGSIVNLLKQQTDVRVLTQPNISAMNRVPSVIFDGKTVPYVGTIASNALQTSVTTTASASFATDGVSLSLVADILSDSEAQIDLVPVITDVTLETINLQQLGTLTAPNTQLKHSVMTAVVENGQTAILGGIRLNEGSNDRRNLPGNIPVGKNNSKLARELVILVQSTVIQPKVVETLVAESL